MKIELALATLVAFPGCQIGMWTVRRDASPVSFTEAGRGPDGLVLMDPTEDRPGGHPILVRGRQVTRFEFTGSLEGVQPAGGFLYRREGDRVVRGRIQDGALAGHEVFTEIPGLLTFAVSGDGRTVLAVTRDGVSAVHGIRGAVASIWLGDAQAVALDAKRGVGGGGRRLFGEHGLAVKGELVGRPRDSGVTHAGGSIRARDLQPVGEGRGAGARSRDA